MDTSHRPVDCNVVWGVHTFEGDHCAIALSHHAGVQYFSVSYVKACHELLACISGNAMDNSLDLVCSSCKVVHEALLRRVDGVINWRVFRTYDMAVAFVKTEQELAQSTALAMAQHRASAFVRDQVAGNNIEVLLYARSGHVEVSAKQERRTTDRSLRRSLPRNLRALQKELIGIQQRYPQLECVARSRLIARRILNSSLSALNDLHESGLVEQHHYAELGTLLEQKIRDLNRLPGSVSVPETTISFLLSVPWLPAHSVPKIRKIEAGERGEESGVEKRDVLANSDSLQYYGGDEPFRDYMVGPGSLGIIGFLNRSPSVCDVTCETDIEVIKLRTRRCLPLFQFSWLKERMDYFLWYHRHAACSRYPLKGLRAEQNVEVKSLS
ncbi:hypothetical protein HPB48_016198 [Haemaphysalis longicornis]|uniref:Uncharacterized protein n=1 Tax=Haemaphysalis longicornis TaxID=44386 RepID=A0A9J6H3P1_HAELO|nr:hypothetical protein HPB48_016198 [Haemaphysalis longicornis]